MTDPVARLCAFLDASPTPDHCAAEIARQLDGAGFAPLDPGAPPRPLPPGTRAYVRKGGTVVAFALGARPVAEAGFRIVAAHTDSPNLRIKPNPVVRSHGWVRLGVEVYGGAIVATWTDRDLGIAGRVVVRDAGRRVSRLVDVRRAVCRIPNLAIHLDRTVNEDGLKLNKQTHLPAVLTLADDDGDPLRALLAAELDCEPDAILAWDLALTDLAPAVVGGLHDEFLFSGRLDNQASCHAGLDALLDAAGHGADHTAVLACFDHEEIGSRTSRGANGRTLESVLRAVCDRDASRGSGGLERALAHTVLISADMAHAVHPAHPDKHDAQHMPRLNAGPVIKAHANHNYTTEGETAALFADPCAEAGAPVQWFVNRSDLRCGSTVGPMLAASLGVAGVDVGNPMLSMHSAREMCGTADHGWMTGALAAFLRGAG